MDIFDIAVLNRTVEQIVPEYGFLTRTFFPGSSVQNATTIMIDTRKRARRIAPFVSPYVQGQLVEKQGFKTFSISPAYIKDKRVFDPNAPFFRTYGEQLMGSMSPMERQAASVRVETADQIEMLNRRIEVMVGEVLATAKLTIVGELYPEQQLDFQRDSELTVALTGSDEWGDTGVGPITDLQAWAQLVFSKSGVRPSTVVMTLDAYQVFMASTQVVDWLKQYNRDGATVNNNAVEGDDGWYAGKIGGFDIWVYSGVYIDPIDNVEKDILPPMTVILGGKGIQGYRAYGAIRDEKAGLQARAYFTKSWIEEDPPVRYLMMQSAPIVAPLYVDAFLTATVQVVS